MQIRFIDMQIDNKPSGEVFWLHDFPTLIYKIISKL